MNAFIQRIEGFFNTLGQESDRSIYLALFRVYVAFHLFKKILFQWDSIPMLFGNQSFIQHENSTIFNALNLWPIREHIGLFFYLFMILLVLFAFGIGKNITALLVYIFLEIYQRSNHLILNGGDNLLKFFVLYMVFADSFKYLSFSPLKVGGSLRIIVNTTTNLAVYSMLAHLCLVYFISGVHKIHADVWFNGVATYYIFSLKRFCGTQYNVQLVQSGLFVLVTTYFTIFWESAFVFLIWKKSLRIWMLVSGILLHVGIYIFMMIHDFEIFFIVTYGFFFTDTEWRNFFIKIRPYLDKVLPSVILKTIFEQRHSAL